MKELAKYEIHDSRFKKYILMNSFLECISTNHLWTEGPVWFSDHNFLLFSDIPNSMIFCWSPLGGVTVYNDHSNYSNGNCRDLQGRLITCQQGSRSVIRTELDGSVTTLADKYLNKPLNSPNDVVVKSDGTIWFTDPTYGIHSDYEGYKAHSQQDGNYVYCLDPNSGDLKVVATSFSQPNGLAFSCDESKLYIVDSGHNMNNEIPPLVKSYTVNMDNSLEGGNNFVITNPGVPDGICVDIHDNLWVSAYDGVHCFAPCGTLLGKILIPEVVANLAFGGVRGNQLFITASSSVYSLFVNTSSSVL